MTIKPGTVERAFQMAGTDKFSRVAEIRSALSREGYPDAHAQIEGRVILTQIKAIMNQAKQRASSGTADATVTALQP